MFLNKWLTIGRVLQSTQQNYEPFSGPSTPSGLVDSITVSRTPNDTGWDQNWSNDQKWEHLWQLFVVTNHFNEKVRNRPLVWKNTGLTDGCLQCKHLQNYPGDGCLLISGVLGVNSSGEGVSIYRGGKNRKKRVFRRAENLEIFEKMKNKG